MTSNSPSVQGSQPLLHQKGEVIQESGTVKQFPVALSSERLHKLLAA